jgi:hypothetical protein
VDQPRGLRTLSETTSLPFREVESLQVVDRGPGQCALELSARGQRFVLVDGVADGGRAQLQTLCRLLQAAVGPALSP